MPKTYKGIPINEHCRPTFLMDTDTKSLITFYQNTSIQQHIKRVIQYDQTGFITRMQSWIKILKWIYVIHHIKKAKKKKKENHVIITVDTEKVFNKMSDKNPQQTINRKEILQLYK